jgi:putative transposase
VFDHCANGQQLKCLTVTDEFTKEGLAVDVDGRIRSLRVIEVLFRLVSARGAPSFMRSDNGPELVSKALLSWIVTHGIGTALIEPGKPWQNGVTESFNGKFRDECLSLKWFRSRAEARVIIEAWRRHYNEVRPHSSLDYLTPNEYVARQKDAAPHQATGRGAAVFGPPRPGPLHHPLRKEHRQDPRSRLKLAAVRKSGQVRAGSPIYRCEIELRQHSAVGGDFPSKTIGILTFAFLYKHRNINYLRYNICAKF